jgi:hypothetical protein
MDKFDEFTLKVTFNTLTILNPIFIKNTGGLGLSLYQKNQ